MRTTSEQLNEHELAELTSELRRIRVFSKRFVESELQGNYRTKFKGSGLIFSDLREYQPGDDVKHIHWKVTARTKRPFVKTYEEERQLSVLLAIDESSSMSSGISASRNKRLRLFSGLVATLARKNGDLLGFLTFGKIIHDFVKPSGARSSYQRIWKLLLESRPFHEATDLNAPLQFMSKQLRKHSVVFLCSDFVSPVFEESLKRLSVSHDVVCVYLKEDWSAALPRGGLVEFEDPESGRRRILDTSSRKVRRSLEDREEWKADSLRKLCRSVRAEALILSSNLAQDFRNFMRARERRSR